MKIHGIKKVTMYEIFMMVISVRILWDIATPLVMLCYVISQLSYYIGIVVLNGRLVELDLVANKFMILVDSSTKKLKRLGY